MDSRDSVAMALYAQCFSWIVRKINQKVKGKENFKSIGILDIFGFENFEVRTLHGESVDTFYLLSTADSTVRPVQTLNLYVCVCVCVCVFALSPSR